jgi:DUF4097 and DUF4098 domain-containing protein YvlB
MRILIGLVLALASTAALAEHECKFAAERNFDIDAAGLKTFALELGSSDAYVEGVAGLKQVEVRGKACASQQEWLDELTLEQSRSGATATVTAAKKHGVHINLFGSSYAYIDVKVRVPAELLVDVDAGSGDANVTRVAALRFGSGSGDLKADHVAGDASVRVGSGDVVIADVGSLKVERAGSGDIRASDVRGDISVGHVGSGDLNFRNVKGGVRVDSIGSGDVMVTHAGGDVSVGNIGSGDVTVDEVGGSFIVHNAGSGDLHHHNVSGKVDVPERHEND